MVAGLRENTLPSYRAAVAAGLPWVEVDARRTADDVLVAAHDPVVPDGRFVAELPSDETDGLGLMRVADLLEELPREIGVDVDVKTSLRDALRRRGDTTAALMAELASALGHSRPLLLSSFDPSALLIMRERCPEIPTGLLTWNRFPLRKAIPAAVHLGAAVVAPHVSSFKPARRQGPPRERGMADSIRVAHEAGLQVLAWCPKPELADELLAAGADCICVDDAPAFARRYR